MGAQRRHGRVQAALDRALGDAEHERDLVDAQVELVAQPEQPSLRGRQPADCLAQLDPMLDGVHGSGGCDRLAELLGRGPANLLAAQVVGGGVARKAGQPGAERRLAAEAEQPAPGLDPGLLGDVERVGVVAHDRERDAVDPGVV